ncbi:hypothetical protein ACFOYZ_29405 [Neobacillus cucumis]|uniref:hypothetical protein n=1 Tax=Neobacillus cucumis TaxID=1740721 RepID=UPI00361F91E2
MNGGEKKKERVGDKWETKEKKKKRLENEIRISNNGKRVVGKMFSIREGVERRGEGSS